MNADNCVVTEETYSKANNIYYAFLNWTVTINEAFEIHQFPFDRQVLKCEIYSSNCKLTQWDKAIPLYPMAPDDCEFGVAYSFDNWVLSDVMVTFGSAGEDGPWSMACSILAARVPEYYLFNIVGILFLIVMFAASVYAIPISDFSSRVSVNITLLLTAVAFKFVTNTWVPQVSYLTLLDKYTMIAIFMLMVQVLENFIVALRSDHENVDDHDGYFAIIYTVSWILFHVVILIGNKFNWFCKSWDKVLNDDDSAGSTAICTLIKDE